jgi:hypothetical protein
MTHESLGEINRDKFYREGHRYQQTRAREERRWRRQRREITARNEEELDEDDDITLLEGKLKREVLKEQLLAYLQPEPEE